MHFGFADAVNKMQRKWVGKGGIEAVKWRGVIAYHAGDEMLSSVLDPHRLGTLIHDTELK
jgi:hypothetical protein